MDLRRALLIAQRWWPVIVAGTLLAAAVAFAYGRAQPRVYDATAMLSVDPGVGTLGGGGDFNELQFAWNTAASDVHRVPTALVAAKALASVTGQLHIALDTGALLQNVHVVNPPQTALLTIDVRSRDAHDASVLANALADAFVTLDRSAGLRTLAGRLTAFTSDQGRYATDEVVARQRLDALQRSPLVLSASRAAEGARLQERINRDDSLVNSLQTTIDTIRLRSRGIGSTVSVDAHAVPMGTLLPSRTVTNVAIAAVLALLVLSALALLSDLVDTRPRSPADIAEGLGLPLLGTIAAGAADTSLLPALDAPTSPAADDYRRLRTAGLTLAASSDSTAARVGRAVAVIGTQPGVGTTTAAANLAIVAARAGTQVVLVEAHVRRPALHTLLDVPRQATLTAALRDGDPRSFLANGPVPGLRLLAPETTTDSAGGIDLVASTAMQHLLATLRAHADLILVDAGSTLLPEGLSVAAMCDAVIVVARAQTTRERLADAAARLRPVTGSLLGVLVPLFTPPTPTGATRLRAGASAPASRATAVDRPSDAGMSSTT